MSDIYAELSTAVIEGDMDGIVDLTRKALDEGLDSRQVLDQGLIPGMVHVGVEFKSGRMFVPEVLLSARAMQAAMDIIKPRLVETGAPMNGKMLLGTVKGDLHDIGKNLVAMMCAGAGFEVRDLGRDVAPEAFIKAVKEFEPDILGMSALLTTTTRSMEQTIKALKEAGLRDRVKIMVGGAPVTQDFCDHIGADGYASDAASAAELARKLVS